MGILPSADKLEEKIGNKYALVIVASKRARQIKEGTHPLVRANSPNPLTVALDEIGEGQVAAIAPPEPEVDQPILPADILSTADFVAAALGAISEDEEAALAELSEGDEDEVEVEEEEVDEEEGETEEAAAEEETEDDLG